MILGEKFEKEFDKQGFTEEQKEWILNRFTKKVMHEHGYKIKLGEKYNCYKTQFNTMTFYKIGIEKRDADETRVKAYKTVRFVGCTPPKAEKSVIIIDSMFEDFYFKKGDKYNPIFTIVVTAYHYEEDSPSMTYEQISEYNENLDNFNLDGFEIIGEPVNTIEEDFPF